MIFVEAELLAEERDQLRAPRVVFLRVRVAARRAGDHDRVAIAGERRRCHGDRRRQHRSGDADAPPRVHMFAGHRSPHRRRSIHSADSSADDESECPRSCHRSRRSGAAFCGTVSLQPATQFAPRRRRARSGRPMPRQTTQESLVQARIGELAVAAADVASSDRRRRAASDRGALPRADAIQPGRSALNDGAEFPRRLASAHGELLRLSPPGARERRVDRRVGNRRERRVARLDFDRGRVARLGRIGRSDRHRIGRRSRQPARRLPPEELVACDRSTAASSSIATTLRRRRPSSGRGRNAERRRPDTLRRRRRRSRASTVAPGRGAAERRARGQRRQRRPQLACLFGRVADAHHRDAIRPPA